MWQQGPLLRKLKDALDVPVYALVDGNPSGILIYLTYRFGSENRAYDSLLLTLPDIKLLGVFPCEVEAKWKGKGVAKLKRLTGRDRRKLYKMLTKDHILVDEELQSQIREMLRGNVVAEIEQIMIDESLEEYVVRKIWERTITSTSRGEDMIQDFPEQTATSTSFCEDMMID